MPQMLHRSLLGTATIAVALTTALLAVGTASSAMATAPDPTAPENPAGTATVTFGVQPARDGVPDTRPFLSYGVTPGSSFSDQVALLNYSEQPLELQVYATDAFNTESGGFGLLPGSEQPSAAGAWIRLDVSQPTLTVPARSGDDIGRVVVPVDVTVPIDAGPGDHAAGIVAVLSTTSADADGTDVTLDQRVGTRAFFRVNGPIRPELSIEGLRTEYSAPLNPLQGATATVVYTLRNTGNVKLAGQQGAQVTGWFGASWTTPTAPEVPLLLPGGSVEVALEVPGVQPRMGMTTTVTVTPLRLEGDDNGEMPVATSTSTFWAIPWLLLAALLLVLVALTVVVMWRRSRRRRRSALGTAAPAEARVPIRTLMGQGDG